MQDFPSWRYTLVVKIPYHIRNYLNYQTQPTYNQKFSEVKPDQSKQTEMQMHDVR